MKPIQILLIGMILSCSFVNGQTKIKEIFQGNNSSEPAFFRSTTTHNFFYDNQNLLYQSDGTAAGTTLLTDSDNNTNGFAIIYNTRETSTVGNKLLFRANHISNGQELWISDGTLLGTEMLKDISTGSSSSNPFDFIPLPNNRTLFTAVVAGEEQLWTTDGTTTGTERLKDFIPGSSVTTSPIYQSDTTLFFYVYTSGSSNLSVWFTNGKPTGTFKIDDFKAENQFTYLNGFWYFSGSDNGVSDYELWKTDLTPAGTSRVKDIVPGNSAFYPTGIKTVNNKVVFSKGNGSNRELWESDGTEAGTVMLKDINPGSLSSFPDRFYEYNNEVYFVAGDGTHGQELWKTNGTEPGTIMVKDINPNTSGSTNESFNLQAGENFQGIANGLLYFKANNGSDGFELWRTDGSNSGTFMVKDINAKNTASQIDNIVFYNNDILFTAESPSGKYDLYISDGTNAGTEPFLTKYGLTTLKNPYVLGEGYNGELFFTAFSPAYGYELFKLSGSTVTLVKDINTSSIQDTYLSTYRESFVATNSQKAYFTLNNNQDGVQLWATDGTAINTKQLSNFNPYPLEPTWAEGSNYQRSSNTPSSDDFITFNDTLYYVHSNKIFKVVGDSSEYFWSDGSRKVNQLSQDQGLLQWLVRDSLYTYDGNTLNSYYIDTWNFRSARSTKIVTIDSVSYLFYGSNLYGSELYAVDLRDGQVNLIKDMTTGTLETYAGKMIRTDSHLFIEVQGTIWISDRTTSGTIELDLYPGSTERAAKPINVGGNKVIFTADDSVNGQEVWVSDGTLAGTHMIEDLGSGNSIGNYNANNINAFSEDQNKVYFYAQGSLWYTNGDSISLFLNGVNGESPYALNGRVYGKAYTGTTSGWEPISADKDGFNMFSDLYSGSESSFAQSFTHVGKKLFFLARGNNGKYAPYVFETCPADLLLNEEISSSSNLLSEFSITGTKNNKIQRGSTVYYQTNEFILLIPGFKAESGAVFKAEIGSGCEE